MKTASLMVAWMAVKLAMRWVREMVRMMAASKVDELDGQRAGW